MKPKQPIITMLALCICIFGQTLFAQTTAFTYQGSLKDGANPANGNYDLEFRLFDQVSGGAQQGSTLQRLNVSVANGIFSVSLDFGAGTLPGADRFLDIAVRTAGGGAFTPLTPRQKVNSAPYSVKSLNTTTADTATNATQLGGVAANQYVVTTDPRLTDARNPTAGSGNYIQNQNVGPQTSSNFNISGTGTANVFNATTQFNLNGNRILSETGNNLRVGFNAGSADTAGYQNTFVGYSAGQSNTSGGNNTMLGNEAGLTNSTGVGNTFVGNYAGRSATYDYNTFIGLLAGFTTTNGYANSFVGKFAGASNTTGFSNSYFGADAGNDSTTGSVNVFVGSSAGLANTTGSANVFVGNNAGATSTTGFNNTIIGSNANVGSENLNNATALGRRSFVSQSDSLVLGSINGVNGADANTNVGIGTSAPITNLHVQNGGTSGGRIQVGDTTTAVADRIITFGDAGCSGSPCVFIGERNQDDYMELRASKFLFLNGAIQVYGLGVAGSNALCRNNSAEISLCSSSLRYKKNIGEFSQGLSFVNKLHPISFDWKDGGMKDVGFGAEDIEKIDPRFVTYNDKGQVEGVKYDRLSVAFVNAFKEQQTQIEAQQKQIDELKAIVCSLKPDAAVCAPSGK